MSVSCVLPLLLLLLLPRASALQQHTSVQEAPRGGIVQHPLTADFVVRSAIAGAFAGMVRRVSLSSCLTVHWQTLELALYPLDTIKTRIQTRQASSRRELFKDLFKGSVTPSIAPSTHKSGRESGGLCRHHSVLDIVLHGICLLHLLPQLIPLPPIPPLLFCLLNLSFSASPFYSLPPPTFSHAHHVFPSCSLLVLLIIAMTGTCQENFESTRNQHASR